MSEVKARRGASFSMLFLAELVAQAAIGFVAVRFVVGGELDTFLEDPTADQAGDYLIYPFLSVFGAMQGMSVLIERARGRGKPWGYGRWTSAYLALCVPLELLLMMKYEGVNWWTLGEFVREPDQWESFTTTLLRGVADYETPPLIAALLALRLGRGRGEWAKGVVDAREWVGRGLAGVLVACFLGMAVLDFVGH
jgi:hypothetical protein